MRDFVIFFSLSILTACGAASPNFIPVPESMPASSSDLFCPGTGFHQVFSIRVDGADVGREVRTDLIEDGPEGPRRFFLSHSVKNEKLGSVLFQNIFIRQEVTDPISGRLIYSSFTKKDQVATHVVQISNEAGTYHRKIFSTSSFSSPTKDSESPISLSGAETIGFRLVDRARNCYLKNLECGSLSFFDAQLNKPVQLKILPPVVGSLTLDGRQIDGSWVAVLDEARQSQSSKYFFNTSGTLLSEEYPEFHESRVLLSGRFSFPDDTSELLVGLRSNSYIYDPNIASSAVYELIASPDRLDKLDLLKEPLNHKITRTSDRRITLRVEAGAPDADEEPIAADLASSLYIRPEDPSIIGALTYLKSAGKKGKLNETRRLNATSIIAQAALLPYPSKFWADPNQSAAMIMQYTSSLLPDKRHTFSMADAVTTLSQGSGDCTEHAVLFASLMRANKIPTRLIAGMLLTPGGLWAYHMWNSYWDGKTWQPIDPSTLTFRPGALYVALGRGASYFKQVRERLADFMWRTFSGVSFNLIEASNNGETLFLAKPVGHEKDFGETALFNAVVMSGRGNHDGALSLLDDHIDEKARTLSIKLMRIELLTNAGDYENALDNIRSVRSETSSHENIFLLDHFEFKCLLHLGLFHKAQQLLDHINSQLSDETEKSSLRAKYLFYSGKFFESISLLEQILTVDPNNLEVSSQYAAYVSLEKHPTDAQITTALDFAFRAVRASYFSDAEYLLTLSRLYLKTEKLNLSAWFADHALTLTPDDASLRSFIKELPVSTSCTNK